VVHLESDLAIYTFIYILYENSVKALVCGGGSLS